MLWIRGLVFTLLVPCVGGGLVPILIEDAARPRGGLWNSGWLLIGSGGAIYLLCLWRFLASRGTPAIFFTRRLKFLIGEEPSTLVHEGLYRLSRNPMYLGVVLVVLGQATLFASLAVTVYGLALGLLFHLAVVFLEEPHLRRNMAGPTTSIAGACRDGSVADETMAPHRVSGLQDERGCRTVVSCVRVVNAATPARTTTAPIHWSGDRVSVKNNTPQMTVSTG
jgi:protein-S-isoprenylcysteine O-methyltransferase Ste14